MKPIDLLEAFGEIPEEDIAWAITCEPPKNRTAFLISKPFLAGVSTAACLLLIVGTLVGVWSRQQRIEPRPPQETITITQTETTVQTSAASQTTASEAGTTQRFTETSAQTVVSLQATGYPTETNKNYYEPTVESSKITSIPAVTSVQNEPLQTSVSVSSLQSRTTTTPVTEQAKTALIPNIVPVSTSVKDSPSTSTAATTSEVSATSAVATMILPTEPPAIDYDTLPGFSVTQSAGEAFLQVTWLSEIPPSPAEAVAYHAQSDRFVLEFAGRITGNTAYWYDIYDTETGKRVRIQMEERRDFSRKVKADGELTLQFVGGHPGFQYLDEQQCALFWDNGCYQCSIYASPDEQEILLPIAESMQPESASDDGTL